MREDDVTEFHLDPSLYFSQTGEACLLPWKEYHTDFGLHNQISAETLNAVLVSSPQSNLIVVDCRFEYEFQGGHIRGAVNISSKE